MILERGALLNNRYRIVEILGQGGMGSVYRAVDENLGVEVAVKDNLFTTEDYARQFRREAVILANLRHPNLPRVTDHFVIDGQGQYLVMDYIEGEDLRQRMDRIGVLPEEDVIMIGAAICDALSYLGSRNPPIVHRDIKPGNVKITPQGQIFLVDFGLAKVLQGSQATTTGARAMTPGYSPPEQYGTARTDIRSDIFSLGATLYAALTGVIPEDALSRAMDQADLTSIRKHNSRVSKRLASLIERSLAVRPDDRFQTPQEFKEALLSARSRSRPRAGEYFVEPPPDMDGSSMPARNLYGDDELVPAAGVLPGRAERSPLPFPISTPINDPISQRSRSRPRRRSGRGCWLVLLIVFVLISAAGLAAYAYDPELPAQALAQAQTFMRGEQPAGFGPAETQTQDELTPTSAATDTPGAAEATETSAAEETTTASVVGLVEASPTASPTDEPTPTATPTPTPTPQPTPQGGGREIAFASEVNNLSQIYLVNLDGTGLRQLTNLPEGACQPDWSPDGTRLVFISPCKVNQERYPGSALFLIDADGSNLVALKTSPGGDFDPDWSPDGREIAFTTLREGGRPRLYAYNLDNDTAHPLSSPDMPYSYDMQPTYSPDGQKIAFVTTRKGPYQIWIMDRDGSDPELFSHSGSSQNFFPHWAPDGEAILYTQLEALGKIPRLAVAPIVDGGLREFTLNEDPIPMREAKYSPDGRWVVYESWPQGGNHDIYIAAANGAGSKVVVTEISFDFDPDWRPEPAPQP